MRLQHRNCSNPIANHDGASRNFKRQRDDDVAHSRTAIYNWLQILLEIGAKAG